MSSKKNNTNKEDNSTQSAFIEFTLLDEPEEQDAPEVDAALNLIETENNDDETEDTRKKKRVEYALKLLDNTETQGGFSGEKQDHEQWLRRLTPQDIIEEVSQFVVGQERAVKDLANYMCMWLRWHFMIKEERYSRDKMPNVKALSLMGSTASGKTFLVRHVLRYLGIDYQYINSSTLTGSGWRGTSVSDVLYEVSKKQEDKPGIITCLFFDEMDKNVVPGLGYEKSFNPCTDLLAPLDCNGEYAGYHEGRDASTRFSLCTDDIIWIFAGTYEGIENVVYQRLMENAVDSYGLLGDRKAKKFKTMNSEELRAHTQPDDLVQYGMMREFVGRSGYLINMPTLTEKELIGIVNDSDNSLQARYSRLFPFHSQFVIDDEAASYLAKRALNMNLGARIMESDLTPIVSSALAQAQKDTSINKIRVSCDPEANCEQLRIIFERNMCA